MKKIILILIILVVLVISGGVSYYFIFRNDPEEKLTANFDDINNQLDSLTDTIQSNIITKDTVIIVNEPESEDSINIQAIIVNEPESLEEASESKKMNADELPIIPKIKPNVENLDEVIVAE